MDAKTLLCNAYPRKSICGGKDLRTTVADRKTQTRGKAFVWLAILSYLKTAEGSKQPHCPSTIHDQLMQLLYLRRRKLCELLYGAVLH